MASKEMWDQALVEFLHQFGPLTTILILVVGALSWYIHWGWCRRLEEKQKEIERLVTEKNQYHTLFLTERRSTEK